MQRGFGELLRDTRKKAGKSMLDLARGLDVSVVFISDVERGNRAPFTSEKILKVAELLDVDPEPLLQAAAETRGAFELDATQVSGKARQVGAALMRGWTELNEKDLDMIAQIVRRRGKSK
jgi:transcriptional regulator with XRE-family HTH domain